MDSNTKDFIINTIPDFVLEVARILNKEGFACYLVGGALRDMLMGILPNDYDLTTDAKPDQVISIFPKSIGTGLKFGTVTVIQPDKEGENHEIHITTLRSEANYIDGRWPTSVEFTKEIHKDLGRRDFTINAIALKLPINNSSIDLIDPFSGQRDIDRKIIRAVGTAEHRFKEDGLRSYKAARLASVLGFNIESQTQDAIRNTLSVAAQVSKERIRDEFIKIIYDSPKPSLGIEQLRKLGLLALFLPELLEGYGLQGGPYHNLTVYDHSLSALDLAPDKLKLPALLHDIAKPRCADGKGHFYGHDILGAKMAEQILTRLRFPRNEVMRVSRLIRWHMFYYPYQELEIRSIREKVGRVVPKRKSKQGSELKARTEKLKKGRKKAFSKGWSDKAIRKLIRNVGGKDYVDDLIGLRIVDALANPKSSFDPKEIQAIQKRIAEVLKQDMAMTVTHLAVDGDDLMNLGVEKGPEIRIILEYLLEQVTLDTAVNNKEDLIKIAKQYITKTKK